MPNPGELRLHSRFRSAHYDARRTLAVLLPPAYDREPMRRFPVLYLQDGQNLFAATTPLGKSWALEDALPRLVAAGAMEPVIAVGIFHGEEARIDELTPTRDPREGRGGGAERYERMLLDEVMPFVAARYRVGGGPSNTAIGGSSLGGLFSLWSALRHPGTFGKVAALSPSAWWDRRSIARQIRRLGERPSLRVWLSVGTHEGRTGAPAVRSLRDAMLGAGWMLGRDLRYHEERGGGHDEHAWAAVVEPALRFLFPTRRGAPPDQGGLERL